jgi:hypothetical protein
MPERRLCSFEAREFSTVGFQTSPGPKDSTASAHRPTAGDGSMAKPLRGAPSAGDDIRTAEVLHMVLHSHREGAAEKLYFAGFFALFGEVAEREGFEPPCSKTLINMGFYSLFVVTVVPLVCTMATRF